MGLSVYTMPEFLRFPTFSVLFPAIDDRILPFMGEPFKAGLLPVPFIRSVINFDESTISFATDCLSLCNIFCIFYLWKLLFLDADFCV